MKRQKIMFGLGGLGLSLALGSIAVGQQDGEADVPAPQSTPVAPAQADQPIENPIQLVVVAQQGQPLRDELQEEMLREILKELVSEGFSNEDAREMLGLSPEALQAQPDVEPSGEVVHTLPDGEALYLPLGTTRTLAVAQGATLEMPFVADGSGVLTVAYRGPGRVRLEVVAPGGQSVQTEVARSGAQGAGVGHAIIPLGRAGEYTVRLTVGGAGDLKLGAEWIPFPQVESVLVEVVPEPDPDTELTIVPGRMVIGSINTADPETQHLWCRFDAEEDGQLVVLTNASQGDITLQSYMRGQYRSAMEYHDDDLNGSVANEGMILDVEAGQTYYARVDMRSGQRCDVEVRAEFIPLPEEE